MKFTEPAPNATFVITSAPAWPTIIFETDVLEPHTWQWTVEWNGFAASGSATSDSNVWDAAEAIANRGGLLTVTAVAGTATATIAVAIVGRNPTAANVAAYFATKAGGDGFSRIVQQETKFKHFGARGVPTKAFDDGYGMCQLTNPAPTFEQAWNWKRNVDAGMVLFAKKRKSARAYLGQNDRTFTEEQLKYETVCRWNGGQYHRWDPAGKKWVRAPDILCDSRTGNIGWDMTDPANTGRTEAELHARDAASYSNPPRPGAHWKYVGVCYADRLLA